MKVAIGEVVDNRSGVYKVSVKTVDGCFALLHDYPVGPHILVKYDPADQFAYPVDLKLVMKLLEEYYAKHERV